MNENEKLPCSDCHNEYNDKIECADKCRRLHAYQRNQPWYHIPPYGEKMAQKQEDTIPAPMESKEMDEYQRKYTEPVKKVAAMKKSVKKQPVEQVKTWQEKYEYCQSTQTCLHCGKPKTKINTLQAGLCKRSCNARWRRNSILHPLYGKFISQNEIKMNWSKEKTQKIAAKKTLNGILDEALRNVGPSLDAAVKRIEARYNPQELHTVKEILDEEKRIEGRKENKMDFDDIIEHRIEQIRTVLTQKALEYATDQDRWHNFNRAAEKLHITPEKALMGIKVKHTVSIDDLVEWAEKCPEKLTVEVIDGKIGDEINYLILLEGLLKKRINKK